MKRRSLAVAVLVSVLVACGGDDGGSTAATPTDGASGTTMAQSGGTVAPVATAAPPSGEPDGVVTLSGLSQDHVDDDVKYSQTPPMGGPHSGRWASCGFHADPIVEEQGVHSMEHGAVWITYAPDLAADQVAALESLTVGRTHVLVSPYDGLPTPVVASAWGKQLQVAVASDPRLAQFVNFFEEGPQTPEPGAPC